MVYCRKIKAYIQFCLGMSAWALESNEDPTFRGTANYTPQQKVRLMANVLRGRLGLTGDEFKTCRLHLLAPLKRAAGMNSRQEAA